jgi:hypothetical protein
LTLEFAHIYLPLSNRKEPFSIGNVLATNTVRGLVVTATDLDRATLTISSIKNNKSQNIKEAEPCASAITHYCLKDVMFQGNELHYKWIPSAENNGKAYHRKVRLNF